MHSSSEVMLFIIAIIDIPIEMMNRRQLRESIVERGSNWATRLFGGKSRAAIAVTCLHCIGVASIAFLAFISNKTLLVLLGAALWALVVAAHVFFDGCLLIRIERALLNDDTWIGFWSLVFEPLSAMGVEVDRVKRKQVFTAFGIMVSAAIIARIGYLFL